MMVAERTGGMDPDCILKLCQTALRIGFSIYEHCSWARRSLEKTMMDVLTMKYTVMTVDTILP